MVKEKRRSSREVRKPKQEKAVVAKTDGAFGKQIKAAITPAAPGKAKGKS
jgi:hypothetical protein